jgi:membrane-associated phospholipid phosphatase
MNHALVQRSRGCGMRYARYIRCLALSLWILYLPRPLCSQEPPKPAADQAAPDPGGSVQPAASAAQNGEEHGARLHWRQLPKNILLDQKTIWTSPLHIQKKDAKWWLIFGGATAALIATDANTSKQLPNSSEQVSVSIWTSRFGAEYTLIPLAATFYIGGKLGDNPRARDTARLGIEALADAEITVNILKTVTQRPRPTEKDGQGHFWDGGDSFPSGHAINSWALATIVAHEFPRPRIIPITAYGLATVVIASRFAGRRHFASDAVLGAGMGYFIGEYVYHKHHGPDRSKTRAVASWLLTHAQPRLEITR